MNQWIQQHTDLVLTFIGFILLQAIGFTIAWTKFSDRMDNIDGEKGSLVRMDNEINSLKIQAKENNGLFTSIKVDLQALKTSQDFITVQISSLRDAYINKNK